MATGSDPFLPGTLYDTERIRRRRGKRLGYGAIAFALFAVVVFGGLAWYGSDSTPQTALQQHRPLATVPAPPMKTLPPIAPVQTDAQDALRETADIGDAPTEPLGPPSPAMSAPVVAPPVESSGPTEAEAEVQAVVAPEPEAKVQAVAASEPEAPKPQPRALSSGRYLVQIGAFHNAANARNLVSKLRGKGYHPFIHTVQDEQNQALHRVILDRAPDKAQAEAAARAFERAERMETLVMLSPSLPERRSARSR